MYCCQNHKIYLSVNRTLKYLLNLFYTNLYLGKLGKYEGLNFTKYTYFFLKFMVV